LLLVITAVECWGEFAIYKMQVQAGEVLFWYGSLATPSLQIASVAPEHDGKNNGGPNKWIIRVKITPQLSEIHLSLLAKSS